MTDHPDSSFTDQVLFHIRDSKVASTFLGSVTAGSVCCGNPWQARLGYSLVWSVRYGRRASKDDVLSPTCVLRELTFRVGLHVWL